MAKRHKNVCIDLFGTYTGCKDFFFGSQIIIMKRQCKMAGLREEKYSNVGKSTSDIYLWRYFWISSGF